MSLGSVVPGRQIRSADHHDDGCRYRGVVRAGGCRHAAYESGDENHHLTQKSPKLFAPFFPSSHLAVALSLRGEAHGTPPKSEVQP